MTDEIKKIIDYFKQNKIISKYIDGKKGKVIMSFFKWLYYFMQETDIKNIEDFNLSNYEGFKKYITKQDLTQITIQGYISGFNLFFDYLYREKIINFFIVRHRIINLNDCPVMLKKYGFDFLEWKKQNGCSYITQLKSSLSNLFYYLELCGITKIQQLNDKILENYSKELKKGYKKSSIKDICFSIKDWIKWLSTKGLYAGDIVNLFRLTPVIVLEGELKNYYDYLKSAGYTKETIKRRRTSLNIIHKFMKTNDIRSFEYVDIAFIEKFKHYLKNKQYSKKYIRLELRNIRVFFNYLASKKTITINPFLEIKEQNKGFCVVNFPVELKKHYIQYIDLKENEHTPSTSLRAIKNCLKVFIKYLTSIEIVTLKELKKNHLKGYVGYLVDLQDKNNLPFYSAGTINRHITTLKNWFFWLSRQNICGAFCFCLKYLKEVSSIKRNILTRKEISSLFKMKVGTVYEFMIKVILVCLYATGVRISELLNISIGDIDFENKVLLIYESKTNKERFVHIGDVGVGYLRIYLEQIRDKIGYGDKTNKVFISNHEDKELSAGTVTKYLQKFCMIDGVKKHISCHCFRHSYGSHLLENGAEIKHISELLGHRDLKTTEGYTRLNPESLKKLVNKYHPREGDDILWN